MTTTARCAICGQPTLSGQSAHSQCGGFLPDNERQWAWACAHHVEKPLKLRPKTVEQLRCKLRPEYRGDVLDMALALLDEVGKHRYRRDHEQLKRWLAPVQPRRPARDDGSETGLFPLLERVRKS
jgi:hypothetical protein